MAPPYRHPPLVPRASLLVVGPCAKWLIPNHHCPALYISPLSEWLQVAMFLYFVKTMLIVEVGYANIALHFISVTLTAWLQVAMFLCFVKTMFIVEVGYANVVLHFISVTLTEWLQVAMFIYFVKTMLIIEVGYANAALHFI